MGAKAGLELEGLWALLESGACMWEVLRSSRWYLATRQGTEHRTIAQLLLLDPRETRGNYQESDGKLKRKGSP